MIACRPIDSDKADDRQRASFRTRCKKVVGSGGKGGCLTLRGTEARPGIHWAMDALVYRAKVLGLDGF